MGRRGNNRKRQELSGKRMKKKVKEVGRRRMGLLREKAKVRWLLVFVETLVENDGNGDVMSLKTLCSVK